MTLALVILIIQIEPIMWHLIPFSAQFTNILYRGFGPKYMGELGSIFFLLLLLEILSKMGNNSKLTCDASSIHMLISFDCQLNIYVAIIFCIDLWNLKAVLSCVYGFEMDNDNIQTACWFWSPTSCTTTG